MPTQLSAQALTGIEQLVTQELVREFTAHSRPNVTVERDILRDDLIVRVRIFGDVDYHQVIDGYELDQHRPSDGPGRLLDTVIRAIVNGIRREPAREPSSERRRRSQAALFLPPEQLAGEYVERFEAGTRAAAGLAVATHVTLASLRALARDLQDSGPAAAPAGTDCEEGFESGVAPSRGDIGASLPSALDVLLSDELEDCA